MDRLVRGLAEEIEVVANEPQKAHCSERQVLSAATPSLRHSERSEAVRDGSTTAYIFYSERGGSICPAYLKGHRSRRASSRSPL